jgi:hypothetical protein
MARRFNEYKIEDKITSIRNTINELSTKILTEDATTIERFNKSPFESLDKFHDRNLSDFQGTFKPQDSTEPKLTHYLRGSYNSDIMKSDELDNPYEHSTSKFPQESDLRASTQSDFGSFAYRRPRWAEDKGDLTGSMGSLGSLASSKPLDDLRMHDPTSSSMFRKTIVEEKKKPEERTKPDWDANGLREHEREKVAELERRLYEKDRVLQEMTGLHNEMLGNLDKLQKDTNSTITKKDFEIQVLKESLYTLERERDDLKAKNAQLTRQIEDSDSNKDQYRRTTEKHTRSLEDLKAQVSRMEQRIYELDSQKNKLIEENTELTIKLQDSENELETADKELEFLRAKIHKLKEKTGKDLELKRDYKGLLQRVEALETAELKYNSEKSEYLAEIQILKERNEGLYRDLQNERRAKEIAIESKVNNTKHSENYELKCRAYKLEDEIDRLQIENDTLKSELAARPSRTKLLEANRRVEELEAVIEDIQRDRSRGRSISVGRSDKDRNYRPARSVSREKNRGRDKDLHSLSQATLKRLINDIMKEFNIETPSALIAYLRDIRKQLKEFSNMKDFIYKLTSLILDCTPNGSLDKNPSLKKIWRWVKRLTEEYLYLKKESDTSDKHKAILRVLLKECNLVSPEDLPNYVMKLRDKLKM